MAPEIVENFPHNEERVAVERPEREKIFLVELFQPAFDRLLLKRLPPPEEGLIVKPQIAEEQSEYGYVVAVGADVEVPIGLIAKFSKFSGPEDIHFDDQLEGDEYVIVYKHDIRGWLRKPKDRGNHNFVIDEKGVATPVGHRA